MIQGPLVSIIMIFLNAQDFIQEAVESVLAQAYSHWELIFVDDGSWDTSTEITLRYTRKYPQKIRYVEHEKHQNLGMSASRNLGFRASQGEYIAFLDADDVYLPQKLERQLAILNEQGSASMVYGASLQWYSWSGNEGDRNLDKPRKLGVPVDTLVQPPLLVTRYLTHEAWSPGTCSALIRRAAFERTGGFEEQFRGMMEDQAFFYKFCLAEPVFVESGCWDLYRQHQNSTTAIARRTGKFHSRKPNPSHQKFFSWFEKYLEEKSVTDPVLWRILHKRLFPYRHPFVYKFGSAFFPLNPKSRLQNLVMNRSNRK